MALQIVNLRLLSHPINWLYVWVILALASLAFTTIHNAVSNSADGSISPD